MRFWKHVFTLLVLILAVIVLAITQIPDKYLHIIACDVGQGDAILITFGSSQILTDGGPSSEVLDCLGKYMPFWDRTIELVVLTHSDADHSTGVVSVLQNYKVDKILINPIDSGTQVYQALKKEVGGRGIMVINPVEGMQLRLGLIYLDILSPTDELINRLTVKTEGDKLSQYSVSEDTNLYSIVYLLSFKEFSGLFTGDIPPEISSGLAAEHLVSRVNYIKIPHHGSVNGLTEDLLKASEPKVAVISVGKNQWGHPRTEILELLAKYGVKTFRTDEVGDIEMITDGEKVWIK